MKLKTADYIGSYVKLDQLPEGNLSEIAMVGRSNVGKSSLINKTLNRKNLAKSSSTPGKTRTINYYLINESWYMVDLPGYGYAKVSKSERSSWGKMIENYLKNRQELKGVIQLLDIRHPPAEHDLAMKGWLEHFSIPHLIVITKADKIARGSRQKYIAQIKKALSMENDERPIIFSAESGEGVEQIHTALTDLLGLPKDEVKEQTE